MLPEAKCFAADENTIVQAGKEKVNEILDLLPKSGEKVQPDLQDPIDKHIKGKIQLPQFYLQSVTVDSNNHYYKSISGLVYLYDGFYKALWNSQNIVISKDVELLGFIEDSLKNFGSVKVEECNHHYLIREEEGHKILISMEASKELWRS